MVSEVVTEQRYISASNWHNEQHNRDVYILTNTQSEICTGREAPDTIVTAFCVRKQRQELKTEAKQRRAFDFDLEIGDIWLAAKTSFGLHGCCCFSLARLEKKNCFVPSHLKNEWERTFEFLCLYARSAKESWFFFLNFCCAKSTDGWECHWQWSLTRNFWVRNVALNSKSQTAMLQSHVVQVNGMYLITLHCRRRCIRERDSHSCLIAV